MGFVNERMSQDDVKKYDIENIDKMFVYGGTMSRSWTRDRERDIYLRQVARGREETHSESSWTFYWGGKLIVLRIQNIETTGPVGGARTGHKKLLNVDIPEELRAKKSSIIEDLKSALVEYADGGVRRTASSYKLILDV